MCAGEKDLDRIDVYRISGILSMCEMGYEIHISLNFSF